MELSLRENTLNLCYRTNFFFLFSVENYHQQSNQNISVDAAIISFRWLFSIKYWYIIVYIHFNAASNFEQALEATTHKAPAVRPPTSYHRTIKVRRTRHVWHCWISGDQLISDVLLLSPSHSQAKAGRPARTYVQQLCKDTGCSPVDLPGAMNNWEEWWERIRDIRAGGMTRWWWWWWWSTLSPICWVTFT